MKVSYRSRVSQWNFKPTGMAGRSGAQRDQKRNNSFVGLQPEENKGTTGTTRITGQGSEEPRKDNEVVEIQRITRC